MKRTLLCLLVAIPIFVLAGPATAGGSPLEMDVHPVRQGHDATVVIRLLPFASTTNHELVVSTSPMAGPGETPLVTDDVDENGELTVVVPSVEGNTQVIARWSGDGDHASAALTETIFVKSRVTSHLRHFSDKDGRFRIYRQEGKVTVVTRIDPGIGVKMASAFLSTLGPNGRTIEEFTHMFVGGNRFSFSFPANWLKPRARHVIVVLVDYNEYQSGGSSQPMFLRLAS